MPRRSTSFSKSAGLLHQPIYLILTVWQWPSSTTCCVKRILRISVLLSIMIFLLSCDILPRPVRTAIRSVIFSLTLYLLVVTLVPVWANMHRLPKTKLITTHIHLVQRSSKLLSPTNSFFTMAKSTPSRILYEDSFQQVRLVKITWRIQKNRQNGQSITLSAEVDRPKICPVRSAMRLVLCAGHLNQPVGVPLGVYKTKKGKSIYLTGSKIAEFLFGKPSNQCGQTQLQRNSSNILLIPWDYGPAFCSTR